MSATSAFDAMGIDGVCQRLMDGASFQEIASEVGLQHSALSMWLGRDSDRSARAQAAKAVAAELWDRKAAESIERAADAFALAKAKELAHHYRWRASKLAARTYADHAKVELTGAGGGPVNMVSYSAEQLAALGEDELQAMLAAVTKLGLPAPE